MTPEATQALYAGERERGEALLEPGRETVFEAAAFGRAAWLAELLSEQPELVRLLLEHGADAGATAGRQATSRLRGHGRKSHLDFGLLPASLGLQ